MENTRAHPTTDGWQDPCNSKYYTVIVQYTARLHAEKLKSFVHKMSNGKLGKQFFNMRLAPEAASDELSGFEHNAVTPISCRTPLPIIISHR
jgi:prolyl-tRNA editing enzyme YbaK/EbsC (Cys-tRNA(Pro) deacylase)